MVKDGYGAGHGGPDPGAVSQGNVEAEIARIMNNSMVSLARSWGHTIINLTVEKGYPYNINEPVAIANANGVRYAVQNHFNAGGGSGVEVWYYTGSLDGYVRASQMAAAIAAAYGIPNRGAKPTTYFGFIRDTYMTAFIIEWGFVDAPGNNDCPKILADPNKGAAAALNALGLGGSVPTPSPQPTPAPAPSKQLLAVDGSWGPATTRAVQKALGTYQDGIVSGQYYQDIGSSPGLHRSSWQLGTSGSDMVAALQRKTGANPDRYFGRKSILALQKYLGTTQDGIISMPSQAVMALQRRINQGKF